MMQKTKSLLTATALLALVGLPLLAEAARPPQNPGAILRNPRALARYLRLTPEQAVRLMTAQHARKPFDLVVVRGRRLASLAAQEKTLSGRLWTYLTDVPHSVGELTATSTAELTEIALASRFLLCQTEELRAFLESTVPAVCGRAVLFPPVVIVPEGLSADGETHARARLAYTGKFAPLWNTLEMTELPEALGRRGVDAEVVMIGDKITITINAEYVLQA